MRSRLTQKTIEKIEPPTTGRNEYWDTILPGFGLRISAQGRKTWVLMYRHRDRQRRMTLGRYPVLGLAEAREEARTAMQAVERGVDPADERLSAKRKSEAPFEDVAALFIEKYAKPKNRTWQESERILQHDAVPRLRGMSLNEITRPHILQILDDVIARGTKTKANRVLAVLRKLFNWAIERGMLEYNPASVIKPPCKEIARDRVLSDNEIRALWPVMSAESWPFGTMMKILLLTGQRRSEVAQMDWDHIDLAKREWIIPREIAKNDRTHHVPLSAQVIDLLESVPRFNSHPHLFSTTGRSPISGFSKVKRRVDEISGISDWRLHDLRRTAASGMARLKISPHVVEKILNHSSGSISGVAAIYNRYGYEDEKREALESWATHVGALVLEQ